MSRVAWVVLGLEAAVTAAICAGLVVAAPWIYRRQRYRYGGAWR